jgi:tRNA (cmo5U34)-methyltransferase
VSEQFHFDPDTYQELMGSEVPSYAQLQQAVADATRGIVVRLFLDLGAGTGVTTALVLSYHPGAQIVGVDESPLMLERARQALPFGDFRVARLEDDLPDGPFDLVVSALAGHHLDGPAKADLFSRVAISLSRPGLAKRGKAVALR